MLHAHSSCESTVLHPVCPCDGYQMDWVQPVMRLAESKCFPKQQSDASVLQQVGCMGVVTGQSRPTLTGDQYLHC